MQKEPKEIEADDHCDEQRDKADKREGFFQWDIGLEVVGHLGVVVIAYYDSENHPGKWSDLPKEAPENTLDEKEGNQSNDDKIKDIHIRSQWSLSMWAPHS